MKSRGRVSGGGWEGEDEKGKRDFLRAASLSNKATSDAIMPPGTFAPHPVPTLYRPLSLFIAHLSISHLYENEDKIIPISLHVLNSLSTQDGTISSGPNHVRRTRVSIKSHPFVPTHRTPSALVSLKTPFDLPLLFLHPSTIILASFNFHHP